MSSMLTHRHALARCLLMLAAALAHSAWGQTAPRLPAADDPAAACYHAATTGGREIYPCDLTVQVARDSGNPQELAAAHANRALVLLHMGRLEAALQDLDAAVQLAPNDADLHGNRGNLLLRMQRSNEALAAHDRAVALAPHDPASYFNRAFSHQALGDSAAADADVAAARQRLVDASEGRLRRADTRAPDAARAR